MQLSITKKIGCLVAAILTVTLSVMLFFLLVKSKNSELAKAKENINEINELLVKALVLSMGEGVTDISPYIEKVDQISNMREEVESPPRIILARLRHSAPSVYSVNQLRIMNY